MEFSLLYERTGVENELEGINLKRGRLGLRRRERFLHNHRA